MPGPGPRGPGNLCHLLRQMIQEGSGIDRILTFNASEDP